MKKLPLYLAIIFFTYSCGTKRVIYNNKKIETKKEKKINKPKSKTKKVKKVLAPRILNTEDYVNYYSNIAMDEMIQYGIPASITLAQGILESGAGKGRLAVEANNHFGIKCHDWNGKKIYHDDDEKQECFRKYDNPEYSYRDHSLFLKNRGRYSFLFDFDKDNYKQWAKGLKKAGYATDPKYPDKLIRLIERFDLAQYDKKDAQEIVVQTVKTPQSNESIYVVKKGETLYSIARELKIDLNVLKRKNNLKGNTIYLGQELILPKR